MDMDKDALVARVKEWQRQSEGHKKSWYDFIATKGPPNYDPARHDIEILQEFVTLADGGLIDTSGVSPVEAFACPEAGEKGMLVQKIKDWQRKSHAHKSSWYNFVSSQGTSNYDPSRHEVETLREFLQMAETGGLDSLAKGMSPEATYKAQLVENVKEWQRMGEQHTQAWYGFINSKGFLNFDPSRHSRDTLQEFMTCASDGSFGIEATGPFSNWSMYAKGGGKVTMPMGLMGKGKGMLGGGDDKGMGKGCMFGGSDDKGMAKGASPFELGKGKSGSNMPIVPPAMAAAMQQALNNYFGNLKGSGNTGSFGSGGKGCGTPPSIRPGDWVCLDCRNVNFAYRTVCNSCGGTNRDQAPLTQARFQQKPGDWVCPNCGDLVFASKSACKMCSTPRPEAPGRVGSKPGDWTCPNCGDLVFASRNSCKMCQTEKPDGLGSAGAALVNAMNKGADSQDTSAGYGSSENTARPSSRYTPY